jgi:DHA1 family tetracycline resistance protein-like MFS transporter
MNKKLWFLFLTIFIDMLGVGILIPVIPQLLGEPNSPYYLLNVTQAHFGLILLGVLMAIYPFATFFAAPVLGAMSDKYGRKPVLFLSILGTSISYFIFAYAIITRNLGLLFASRLVDGLTGGNISVAQAAIADSVTPENRTKAFGSIGAAFGLGFIIGPFLGGVLSTPSILPFFNASTPFIFSGILSLFNAFSIYFFFKESIREKDHARKIDAFGAFKNIVKAQKFSPEVRTLFLISFLINAGMAFFYSFFNVYLTNKFGFSPAQIGNFFAYVGIWIIITQVVVVRYLAKKHKEIDLLGPAYFMYALGVLLYLLPNKAWMLLLVVPIASIPNGVQMANFSALLSKKTEEKMRGEVMGVNSSVSSLGQSIPPILAGFIAAATATFVPIVFGALIVVVAGFIFVTKVKNAKI